MKACILLLALFAASVGIASASGNQTYTSLPVNYIVDLSFNLDGVETTAAPCTDATPGNPCIPLVKATQDSITIKYSINTTVSAMANATSTITIKGCYSPTSSKDRPWRKAKPVIADDKQCSVKIASAKAPEGTFTWTPPQQAAPATYSVRVLEVCADGSYCGMGNSKGFYQIDPIDNRPTWLMVMAGCFAAIGPIVLASFMTWEYMGKKKQ